MFFNYAQISILPFVVIWIIAMVYLFFFVDVSKSKKTNSGYPKRPFHMSRKDYYNNIYLKSEAWQRKRYVVFKRDNWKCVHCGARATEVHHKRYAKYQIGREPIHWLESVCRSCHENIHT